MPRKEHGPWKPPEYEIADAAAIQAVAAGTATPDQQKRAVKWIIECGAATYDFHYFASERDTAFSLGRQFVGQQTVKLIKMRLDLLRKTKNA